MAIVTNTVRRADGVGIPATVTAELVDEHREPIAGTLDGDPVSRLMTITTDAGYWALDLAANELVEPAGTLWLVTELVAGQHPARHLIEVPAGEEPSPLVSLLAS